ncbi:hypothetical protein [Actinoplanes sp. TFC3]|nr:hypothetical protein [Actinoplanes sp. TFC3]
MRRRIVVLLTAGAAVLAVTLGTSSAPSATTAHPSPFCATCLAIPE